MKLSLDESVLGCFFFFCNLDESVPNPADTSRSRFSHVQRAIQDCEVGSRDGCSWGVRRIPASSTLCRRHVHWQRFSQFKTALQAPNLPLHAPGSAWRQSAKVWRQPRRSSPRQKAKLAFEEDELSKAEHRLVALQQESKTVPVSTPFSVDPSRVHPDVEAEFKKMQEVIASLQQELSALRSGQVGVPQTEPDSSEADAIHLLRAQVARLEEEARGSGVRETKRRTGCLQTLALTNPSPMVA